MKKLLQKLRDWIRGFTDEDVASLKRKIREFQAEFPIELTRGKWMQVTRNEYHAFISYDLDVLSENFFNEQDEAEARNSPPVFLIPRNRF